MRGDRLVSILLLLQSHGKLTARQLAEKLEVSERTIHRDMDSLSSAGIPVVAERGTNGGWSLIENYETSLTGLKESEIQSLFVSPSMQILEDLGMNRTSEEARMKLIASLPTIYREQAKNIWDRIHVDTSTWKNQKENIVSFEVLKQAIWQQNKLKIKYERGDGTGTDRVVQPLGLVAKGGRWYLIASKEDGEVRNYRASRIHSAVLLDETFERPGDFDLANYWRTSTESFVERLPKYEVLVEISPFILSRLTFTNRFVEIVDMGDRNEEDWIPVKLSFNTEDEAKGYILGYADQIKIIEPEDLCEKVVKMAESVVEFYKL